MFTTGCQAETEMVFIALVSASLLLWHWGQTAGWPARRTWIASYACVGLAVLCKGPQPPVYFLGSVGVYLLLTGQWRRLCSRAHLAGAAVCVAIVLAWLIPYMLRTSWPTAWQILMGDTTDRLVGWNARDVGVHLLTYPLEIFGCTFPWSLLLFAYTRRDVRQFLGEARPLVHFAAVCLLIAFPTCWVPPEGQTRYFAPLYPCLAVLIGVVVDRCARADVPAGLRAVWSRYAWFMACVMVLAATGVMLSAAFLAGHAQFGPWAEQPRVALGYAAALAGLVLLLLRGRQGGDVSRVRLAVVAVAGFMVLSCTGIITNVRARRSEDQATTIARLKEQLPPGQRLVGFGEVDDLFAYYYALPIDCLPMPANANDPAAARVDYFCCGSVTGDRPVLPFAWQELTTISMDRNHHVRPERAMVVGRVLHYPPSAASVGAENH
jgi:4-amino-4-deoxy-L-arabinose transferase-like glycosyltransferase